METTYIYVICSSCRHVLALEWDTSSLLSDNPLVGRKIYPAEVALPALLLGVWPQEKSAPSPLCAGVWAALATRALSFVRLHLARHRCAEIFLADELPDESILELPDTFEILPKAPSARQPIKTFELHNTRNLTIERRMELAANIGAVRLWEIFAREQADLQDGLLLFGWLPADTNDDARLFSLILNTTCGHVAEEALAARIVLGTSDPGLRRQQLLTVAESAYARRGQFWGRVRETPYDHVVPLEELQAKAVERLIATGDIEQACHLAVICSVAPSRLGQLREKLSARILDRSLPIDTRYRMILSAQKIFSGLISELRRKYGLACDPLPSMPSWLALEGPAKTMACVCADPDAVCACLASPDVSCVMQGLDMIKELSILLPEETLAFAVDVLALCRDNRTEPTPGRSRLCVRAREVHSRIFAAMGGTGAWEALQEVIDAMFSAGLGVSLGMHFRALSANKIPVDQVGALLIQRVTERTRAVRDRIQAREALSVLADEGGAVQRNQPVSSPEGRDAARQADDFLIAALQDPLEPEELKSAIRSSLTRWMPDRINELQGTVISRVSVPSITKLIPGQSIAGIDKNEVMALLRDPDADIGRVLAAITLAEPFVRMKQDLASQFERLLRMRIKDNRRFSERAWNRNVAVEARLAHGAVWKLLKPEKRPAALDLIISFREIAMAQEAPSIGECSLAGALADTVSASLAPLDLKEIAVSLETDIANRRLSAWTRLHTYHALATLKDHGGKADKALFAALADPDEDPVLRAEAHALLAPRLKQPVFDLQNRGKLPRPPIPPVETLFHNLPLFERDTRGEWCLTPDALRWGCLTYPDDLMDALLNAKQDPARACAAAALAPLVAQRLPFTAGQLTEAMREAGKNPFELHALIEGREHTFCLAKLCQEGIQAVAGYCA